MKYECDKDKQFTTDIKLKGESLEIVDEVKLLGVVINNNLKWDKNTSFLVKKANKKMRMLHIAAKFTRNRDHLMQIYKTFIRSHLEFSSNVWHSSLTKENRQDLERVQKAALKVILGKDHNDYDEALKLLRIQSLEQRREMVSLRFVKNSLKNANFAKLFPLTKANHVMNVRNPIKYHINKANTERYRRSTIPYLQLNRDILKRKCEFKDLKAFIEPKRKRTEKNNHCVLVNYVSFADPITSITGK